jgi:integrase
MSDLATIQGTAALAALATARAYAGEAMASATVRAYRADWAHFTGWCGTVGLSPLPADPATVAAYLGSLAGEFAPNTMKRRLSSISQAHKLHGLDWRPSHPLIVQTLRGILRRHGRPVKQATAIRVDAIRALVGTCDGSPAGLRDRALLLVGFAGAMRRSEIVGLYADDVAIGPEGARVLIRRSKTDQTREGATIGLPRGEHAETCPVMALEAWLSVLPDHTGPLFRRLSKAGRLIGRKPLWACAVRDILAKRAQEAEIATHLTAHGLRAGFITEAYDRGLRDDDIMPHSRHRDLRSMRGYVRRAKLMSTSPAGSVGL